MPPTSPVEMPALNRRLASAGIAWRYGPAPNQGEARFSDDVARGSPLLRDLRGVQLKLTYPLVPPPGSRADSVLLRLRDGAPWAIRGARATGGSFVLLGSPLDGAATTLPTTAAMLPLLDLLLNAWSARSIDHADVSPGEPVELPAGSVAVVNASGARDSIAVGESYRAASEPGVYRILGANGAQLGAFVINPADSESDLAAADSRRLRTALGGWAYHTADDAEGWADAIYRRRLGREIWRPLLIAMLLLLLVESMVDATGRSGHATGSASQVEAAPATRSLTG